ncbi:hypothetical protein HYS31_01750 [Candidatus Woesearchaeota archaeon]|nr:hypothetical protein [Candidatus Woesearchaeota archaeon]
MAKKSPRRKNPSQVAVVLVREMNAAVQSPEPPKTNHGDRLYKYLKNYLEGILSADDVTPFIMHHIETTRQIFENWRILPRMI